MARNRMIKPEFWEDDKIAECSPIARLLFIALWNFADDEGFVEYRPKWLKTKCLPYDDVNIAKLVTELQNTKSVKVQNGIIHVVHFLDHQKIDRPRLSDLKAKFNSSTNDRRMIDEESTTKREIEYEIEYEIERRMNEKDFEIFWKAYPVKKSRKKALEKFKTLEQKLLPKILQAIEEQKKEKKALIAAQQFCPEWKHPTTWLNGACWDDEPIEQLPDPNQRRELSKEEMLQKIKDFNPATV